MAHTTCDMTKETALIIKTVRALTEMAQARDNTKMSVDDANAFSAGYREAVKDIFSECFMGKIEEAH